MKLICILLLAFAIASVSSQSSLSFAEFIQGHNLSLKKYLVIGSSNRNVNDFIKRNKFYVIVYSDSDIMLEIPCGNCKKLSHTNPTCSFTRCSKSFQDAMHDFKTVVFARSDAASFFWNQNSNQPLQFIGPKGSLNFVISN